MTNVFTTITEVRQLDTRLDDATYREWLADGFEYRYGKFIRKQTVYLPLEQMKKPVAGKKAA